MILKTIIIVIVLYELFKVLNLKLHSEAFKTLKDFSKFNTEEERQLYIRSIKHPILAFVIIVLELVYMLIAVILLFTPLVWISTIMILLSIVIGITDALTDKKYEAALKVGNSIITVGLLVYAFHSIL